MLFNLNRELQGFVWSEILITVITGFFWHLQTFLMIFGLAAWYSVIVTVLSFGVLVFQFVIPIELGTTHSCSKEWMLINFFLTPFSHLEERDVGMLIINLTTCVLCFKLPKETHYEIRRPEWSKFSPKTWGEIESIHCAAWLFVAGCIWPSLLSAPYFICALGCALAWAWSVPCLSTNTFQWLMRAILVVTVAHQILLLSYQQPWAQDAFPPNDTFIRLLGITKLTPLPCLDKEEIKQMYLPARLNPLVILFLFFTIRSFVRGLNEKHEQIKRESEENAVTIENPETPQVVAESNRKKGKDETVNLEDLILGTINNTIMMVWSVIFHSWLGFLMLLWANVMWMVPRQHSAMGKSSRALSIYASLLLVLAFCFSFDYEWPSHFGSLSLYQFGLLTDFSLAIIPLLIKCGLTLTILIVLRQYTRPYFVALQIPVSGFKQIVQIVSLMWVRYAILVGIILMIVYDHKMYKSNTIPCTLGLLIAIFWPENVRLSLRVFITGLLLTSLVKLCLLYVYQFDGSPEFFDSIFYGLNIITLEQALGMRVVDKKTLLVHLWITTIVAMFSAIFLTVVAPDMYKSYEKSWSRWRRHAERYIVAPVDSDTNI